MFEIFHGEILVNAVRLQKAVEFVSGLEPEEKEEFGVGDVPALVFLERKPFEGHA